LVASVIQQPLHYLVHPVERLRKSLDRNRLTANTNPFRRFRKMWRDEQARAVPRRAQPGFDHGAGRAFPVRPGHMHEPTAILRIVQGVKHRADTFQAEFCGLDLVAESVKEMDGIRVVHGIGF
jgi:hypothetical protein